MTTDAPSAEYSRALAENARYAAQFDRSTLSPARRLAILACMDGRLTIEDIFGLRTGDAHIIRNAGGLATDDALRSLVISQRLLDTRELLVVAHTGCGMLTFRDDELRAQLAADTGVALGLTFHAFSDLEASLRAQVERIRSHPWLRDMAVHGVVYEVETGRVREIA